jgi:hypothetical protein
MAEKGSQIATKKASDYSSNNTPSGTGGTPNEHSVTGGVGNVGSSNGAIGPDFNPNP